MSNNEHPHFSAISLYARPPDVTPYSAMFALLDENNDLDENNNNMSSEVINLIHSRLNNPSDDSNRDDTEWSVHHPETRTVFQNLRIRLKDIESVYKKYDTIEHNVVLTTETVENIQKLEECVSFFKEKIELYFNKFIDSQIQCEREEAFLSHCSSLLDVIQNPSVEEEDFNECASNICQSLETFTSQIQNKISHNRKNREIYWSQYRELRDSCKLINEVQSDIVCQVCMEREVDMAVNCGHCFCSVCASRCNYCPNCRTPLTQKLKLFF